MGKDSEELKLKLEKVDIENVLSTENGRRFIWRLLTYCGIYQDIPFDDSHLAAKQAGKRQVGLFLLGILSENNELQVFKMMQEARNAAIEQETKNANREQKRREEDSEPRLDSGEPEYPFGIPNGGNVFDSGESGDIGDFI